MGEKLVSTYLPSLKKELTVRVDWVVCVTLLLFFGHLEDVRTVSPLFIIMYIYHALISALSAHMIHINLNMMFCTHVERSPAITSTIMKGGFQFHIDTLNTNQSLKRVSVNFKLTFFENIHSSGAV